MIGLASVGDAERRWGDDGVGEAPPVAAVVDAFVSAGVMIGDDGVDSCRNSIMSRGPSLVAWVAAVAVEVVVLSFVALSDESSNRRLLPLPAGEALEEVSRPCY